MKIKFFFVGLFLAVFFSSFVSCQSKKPDTPDVVKDKQDNEFKTIKIGDQVWMAENMKVSEGRDGQKIEMIEMSLKNEINEKSFDKLYSYHPNNDWNNDKSFGYLYNWASANIICPKGWHLPTEAEWKQLINYVSSQKEYVWGEDKNCIAQALASKDGWADDPVAGNVGNDPGSNNATGFGALAAGYNHGYPLGFNQYGYYWTATQRDNSNACWVGFDYNKATVSFGDDYKDYGYSVRCVKD